MRLFQIQGHGIEAPVAFESRFQMPENTYLVMFVNGGVPLLTRESCRFLDFFRNKKNQYKLLDPVKHKDELAKHFPSIRIYKPGDYIPKIKASLLSDHLTSNFCNKSGIYEYPNIPLINRKLFPVPDNHNMKILTRVTSIQDPEVLSALRCYKYSIFTRPGQTRLTKEEYEELYRGSLVKPGYANYDSMLYDLSTIMTILGEGVYYFGGCRSSVHGIEEDPVYEEIAHILNGVCKRISVKLATVRLIYSLQVTNNKTKAQKTLQDANVTLEDLENFTKLQQSRAYKRLSITNLQGLKQKMNLQYHDDFVALSKQLLLKFKPFMDEEESNTLEAWVTSYGHVHPHQDNLDYSNEQQHGVRRTAQVAKRMRSTNSASETTSSSGRKPHIQKAKISRVSPRDRKLSPMSIE